MHLLLNNESTVQGSDTTVLNQGTAAGNTQFKIIKRSLFIALLFISGVCCAQQPLTLDSAITIALRNSYDIELAKNYVEAADVSNSYGIAGGLPVVAGTASDREQINTVNQKISTGETINRNAAAGNTVAAGLQGTILFYITECVLLPPRTGLRNWKNKARNT